MTTGNGNVVQIPRWLLGVGLSVTGALLLMFAGMLAFVGAKVWDSANSAQIENIRLQGEVRVLSGQVEALRNSQHAIELRLERLEE